jgi:hypothetical protein
MVFFWHIPAVVARIVGEGLDEAPSDKERQQSLDNCIELLKGVPVGLKD